MERAQGRQQLRHAAMLGAAELDDSRGEGDGRLAQRGPDDEIESAPLLITAAGARWWTRS
ncbi:MAG: hypothetical protein ACT4P3_19625 [Betaproteobacteria bacterium]